LFRLEEDRALINRLGFNNGGQAAALARLQRRKGGGILGVNIGANKESGDRIGDYRAGVRAMKSVADYLTINISSPIRLDCAPCRTRERSSICWRP
jgi:dihydroorotate dehydrogenase